MAKSGKKPPTPKSSPLPGVLDGKPWTIRESLFGDANIDRRSHVLTAPLGITPQERQARNHEMLHLKFSPKVPPKLPPGTDPLVYQACEDYRVNKRGRQMGIYQDVPNLTEADVARWRKAWKDKPHVAGAALMAAEGTPDETALREAFRADYMDPATGRFTKDGERIMRSVDDAVWGYMRSARASAKKAVEAAYYISQLLAPTPEPEKSGAEGKGKPSEGEIERDTMEGVKDLLDPGTADELRKRAEKDEYVPGGIPTEESEYGQWGVMNIVTPELSLTLPGKMRSRRWKPTDTGSVFRYAHRYCGDGSVFVYKGVRDGGCTLLIDVSGSMSLRESDILKIMHYMPAALIATYSGRNTDGNLTIIAKKGRRAPANKFRTSGAGNIIDGPALTWLAQQPGPRYWVCDGYVTGCYDDTSPVLNADAYQIATRNHIMRISSMKEVIEKFEHLRAAR